MRITYEISEQDFLNGQRLALRNLPQLGARRTRFLAGTVGAGLCAGLVNAARPGNLAIIPAAIAAFALAFFSQPWVAKRKQKQLYSKSTSMHGNQVIEADNEGIRFQGPLTTARTSWALFSRFFEDQNGFVLVQQSGRTINIIPKRQLAENEISGLRDLLRAQVGQ